MQVHDIFHVSISRLYKREGEEPQQALLPTGVGMKVEQDCGPRGQCRQ